LGLAAVPDWAPGAFGVAPGAATVMATRIAYAQDGTRAEVSRNWIDTEVAAYVARIA
jgi:GntR family transcriptional regulator